MHTQKDLVYVVLCRVENSVKARGFGTLDELLDVSSLVSFGKLNQDLHYYIFFVTLETSSCNFMHASNQFMIITLMQ